MKTKRVPTTTTTTHNDGRSTKSVRARFKSSIDSIANIPGLTEQDVHALCSLLGIKTGR